MDFELASRPVVRTKPEAGSAPQGGDELQALLGNQGVLELQRSGASPPPDPASLSALAHSPSDPFAAFQDTDRLLDAARRLGSTYRSSVTQPGDRQATSSRASALRLLERAAIHAHGAHDTRAVEGISEEVAASIRSEQDPHFRAFGLNRLGALRESGDLTDKTKLRKELHPDAPPYAAWGDDVHVRINSNPDGPQETADLLTVLREDGYEIEPKDDGTYSFRHPTTRLTGTVHTLSKQQPGGILEGLENPADDAIVYMGHANYGRGAGKAVANAKPTKDKLVALLQCSATSNIDAFAKALPGVQLMGTTNALYDVEMYHVLRELLAGLGAREDWVAIRERISGNLDQPRVPLVERLKKQGGYPAEVLTEKYFYPDQRRNAARHKDLDDDGVNDADDVMFDAFKVQEKVPSAQQYEAVPRTTPPHEVSGGALKNAAGDLQLFLRYNHLLAPDDEKRVPWSSDSVVVRGIHTPKPGDTAPFQFTRDGDKVIVSMSSSFAGAGKTSVAQLLAVEAGRWFADEVGMGGADKDALSATMLSGVRHQIGPELWEPAATPGLHDALLGARYGFGASLHELDQAAHPSEKEGAEYTQASVRRVKSTLAAAPKGGWRKEAVPSEGDPQSVAKTIGGPGSAVLWEDRHAPSTDSPDREVSHVAVQAEGGSRVVRIDTTAGQVAAVSSAPFSVEATAEQEAERYAVGLEQTLGVPTRTVTDAYAAARRESPPRRAMAIRRAVQASGSYPPGSWIPPVSGLEALGQPGSQNERQAPSSASSTRSLPP